MAAGELAAATLSEVTLLRTGERRAEDRGTKWLLIATAVAGFLLAAAAQRRVPGLAFAVTGWAPTVGGIASSGPGILLRGWAIATLGRFFRRDIQVAVDQPVVTGGPYAAIRHPAYTGNLLMFAGAGVLLANWGSLVALVAVPLVGVVRRITVEEALVAARLGEPYRALRRRAPPGSSRTCGRRSRYAASSRTRPAQRCRPRRSRCSASTSPASPPNTGTAASRSATSLDLGQGDALDLGVVAGQPPRRRPLVAARVRAQDQAQPERVLEREPLAARARRRAQAPCCRSSGPRWNRE